MKVNNGPNLWLFFQQHKNPAEEIWTFGSVLVCSLCPAQDPHGGPELARPCEACTSHALGVVGMVGLGFQTFGTQSYFDSYFDSYFPRYQEQMAISHHKSPSCETPMQVCNFSLHRPSIAELYSWRYRDLGNLPNVLTDERQRQKAQQSTFKLMEFGWILMESKILY